MLDVYTVLYVSRCYVALTKTKQKYKTKKICIAYVRKKKDIIITIHKFLQKPFFLLA